MTDFVPYEPGTIQVTNGSKNIVGTGTDFSVYSPRDKIIVDGYPVWIDTITDDTHFTALYNYLGSSGSGKTYAWEPTSDLSRAIALDTRLSSYFTSGNLSAEAGLTGAADVISYFTGVGTKAVTAFTSQARQLVDDTSFSAMRTTLGLGSADTPQFAGLAINTSSPSKPLVVSDLANPGHIGFEVSPNDASTPGAVRVLSFNRNTSAFVPLALEASKLSLTNGNMVVGGVTASKKFVVTDGDVIGYEVSPNDASYPGSVRTLAYNRAGGAFVGVVAEALSHLWYAGSSADKPLSFTSNGALVVGAPTGGDKGAGTINAVAVYDDNSLLTCTALRAEFIKNGTIDLAFWDSLAPNIVIAARTDVVPVTEEADVEVEEDEIIKSGVHKGALRRRVVTKRMTVQKMRETPVFDTKGKQVDVKLEPVVEMVEVPEQVIERRHETAHLFKRMIDDGFDPRDPIAYLDRMETDQALPGMPTEVEWEHGALSMGELSNRKWLAMEMMALAFRGLVQKHVALDDRVAALEAA